MRMTDEVRFMEENNQNLFSPSERSSVIKELIGNDFRSPEPFSKNFKLDSERILYSPENKQG